MDGRAVRCNPTGSTSSSVAAVPHTWVVSVRCSAVVNGESSGAGGRPMVPPMMVSGSNTSSLAAMPKALPSVVACRVPHLQISGLGRGANLAFQQAGNDQPNGVYGALRHGGVGRLPQPPDDGGAVLTSFKGHALGLFQCAFRQADGAGCAVGRRVWATPPTRKSSDAPVFQHGADQLAAKTAFFAVGARELSIQGKAESGCSKWAAKIVYVVHVGFLVGTQQGSARATEGDASVFQGIQAAKCWGLCRRPRRGRRPVPARARCRG